VTGGVKDATGSRGACSRGASPLHVRTVNYSPNPPMRALLDVILIALNMYMWIVIAAVILSWLVAFNVVNTRHPFVAAVAEFLYRITEPVLRPIRNMLPHLGGIDISPIVLFLIIILIQRVIEYYIYPYVS
jgi:YggT family protein